MIRVPDVRFFLTVICLTVIGFAGCGGVPDSPSGADSGRNSMIPPEIAAKTSAAALPQEQPPGGGAQVGERQPASQPGKLQRQIIYDADVRLVVEDFEGIPEKVDGLVRRAGGFVSQQKLHGQSGRPRGGEWKIRLPLEGYADFLEAAKKFGELQNLAANSQDVTDQYYDLEARIRNKQKEEARLLKHLEESTGKLEEILAVEREISRVRDELERMEGRLRVLQDVVSLATVTLHVDEIKGYIPPQTPTFALRISRAFAGSWKVLVAAGQGLVVVGVVVGPWLGAIGIPSVLVLSLIRLRRRAT